MSPAAAGRSRTVRRVPRWGALAAGLLCGVVLYLILTPLAALLFTSLSASPTGFAANGALSLANLAHVVAMAASGGVILDSVVYSAGTVGLAMAATVTLAYLLERTDLPSRGWLRAMILGPLGVPPIVLAMAWVLLGNPRNGLLSLGGRLDVLTLPGMIFVTATVMVPSMYLLLSGHLAQLDPALEEAASTVGVGLYQRTLRITLGLLKPALLAAAALFLMISLETFDVAAVIGLPRNVYVFSTAIYVAIFPTEGSPEYGVAAAYGVLLVALSLVLIALYRRYTGGDASRFRVVTGRGYRPTRIRLGRWRAPALCFVGLVVCVSTLAPLAVLIWSSVLPFYGSLAENLQARLTLGNYAGVFGSPDIVAAVWHTALIVLVAATVTTAVAGWAAWASHRGRFRAARLIVDGSFLMLGVPGVVIGIALIFWYLLLPRLHVPLHLYGTVWILVIAYVTRFLAYTGRLMDAAVRQIDEELENAAYVSGASRAAVARYVVWPLLAPSLVRAWLWVAVHVVREIPIAALLMTVDNQTLAAALWESWSTSSTIGQVSAFAVLLTALSMLGTWGIARLAGAEDHAVAGGL